MSMSSCLFLCDFSILNLEKLQTKGKPYFSVKTLCLTVNKDHLLLMATVFILQSVAFCYCTASLKWVQCCILKKNKMYLKAKTPAFYFCWISSTVKKHIV